MSPKGIVIEFRTQAMNEKIFLYLIQFSYCFLNFEWIFIATFFIFKSTIEISFVAFRFSTTRIWEKEKEKKIRDKYLFKNKNDDGKKEVRYILAIVLTCGYHKCLAYSD